MPVLDPWFYVLAIPAVLIAGIGKTGFGGGLGVIAVPLLALAISPVQAAAIMLPILCFMDLFGIWAFRKSWDRRNVTLMVIGSIVGIAFGTFTFGYVSPDVIRIMIGCLAIAFTLRHWLGASLEGRPQSKGNPVLGIIAGAVSAYGSFVAHAGGPPAQAFLLPQRMEKSLFVGTTVVYFFIINFLKIIPYGMTGQWTPETVLTAVALAPLAPLGVWMGLRVMRIVSEKPFYRFVYGLLFAIGIKLLWDGTTALL